MCTHDGYKYKRGNYSLRFPYLRPIEYIYPLLQAEELEGCCNRLFLLFMSKKILENLSCLSLSFFQKSFICPLKLRGRDSMPKGIPSSSSRLCFQRRLDVQISFSFFFFFYLPYLFSSFLSDMGIINKEKKTETYFRIHLDIKKSLLAYYFNPVSDTFSRAACFFPKKAWLYFSTLFPTIIHVFWLDWYWCRGYHGWLISLADTSSW